jgi:hypothetical protein
MLLNEAGVHGWIDQADPKAPEMLFHFQGDDEPVRMPLHFAGV